MIKTNSLFGYVPATTRDPSSFSSLAKLKDNVQKAVDGNNNLVQQIWYLKIQAGKTRNPVAQNMILEEASRLQLYLDESQAQERIEKAIDEVKEMETRLSSIEEAESRLTTPMRI